jgi:hypothetical protein
MARAGYISHDLSQTAYRCAGAWTLYGENVGVGPDVQSVHQAFMNSPGHRENILFPYFTELGTGTAWSKGNVYVTEIYVRRPAEARLRLPRRSSQPRKRLPGLPVAKPGFLTVLMLERMMADFGVR